MKVIKLLLQASPAGFVIAAIVGALGGAASGAFLHAMTKGMRAPTPALGVLFALLIVVQIVLAVGSHAVLASFTARMIEKMRSRIARAALTTPYPKLEKIGLPRIRTAIMEDAQTIGGVSATLVGAITAAATLIGAFGYLAWMSPLAALSTALLAVVASFAYRRLSARGIAGIQAAFKKRARMYEVFEGVILGATEVRLHEKRRRAILDELGGASQDLHTNMAKGVSYTYAAEAVGQTALFLAVAAAVATLAAFGSRYGGTGLIVAVVFVQTPIMTLLAAGPDVAQASASATQLEGLLGNLGADTPIGPAPDRAEQRSFTSLALNGIKFKYPESPDPFDLGPIDLAIKPGEIVFLAGGNGSGKTTLAKVLVGLYTPEGEIVLDGKPVVTEADRERYRNKFSVVFAEGFVFPELWGVELAKVDEKANALLGELKLSGKVQVKDGHLSTTQLSSGQKKRLALLAAYLEERPLFLFDEWAADQDPEFKRVFYTKFLPEIRNAGKSAIVISHDDRYFDVADRVIHLERGRIADGPTAATVVA